MVGWGIFYMDPFDWLRLYVEVPRQAPWLFEQRTNPENFA